MIWDISVAISQVYTFLFFIILFIIYFIFFFPAISPASWREGQKLVKMVLGPGPGLPREEPSSHPAGRQTRTGEAHQHELLPPLYIPGHDVLSGGTLCSCKNMLQTIQVSREDLEVCLFLFILFFFRVHFHYGMLKKFCWFLYRCTYI